MEKDIKRVYISEEQLAEGVEKIARSLSEDYKDKRPLMVCILKGSIVFFSDLIRKMNIELDIDFLKASSYGAQTFSSGVVNIKQDLTADISGRHVVLVEDIIDSGRTLSILKEYFAKRNPASVKICTLLDKPMRRVTALEPDYKAFDIEDEFVVGYGLDFNEKYRNLPYVGILKEEAYK